MRKENAFTLLEVLVVAAVVAIFGGSAIFSLVLSRERAEVNRVADQVTATLNLARSRTVSSQNLFSWGVHLESDKYVLFKGATYNPNDSANEVFNLDPRVEIKNIALGGGGAEVIFLRPAGRTNTFGTFNVASKKTGESRLIRTEPSGLFGRDTQASGSPTNPNGDTRHIHLTLGWSIRNSTTLTLTFQDPPNANVVKNITMAAYFNADKTNFDWEGEVNVNGSVQQLRIHTHTLDDVKTVLSISRDRRLNDKALIVTIDGSEVIRYTADGQATVGPFGGTMEIQ